MPWSAQSRLVWPRVARLLRVELQRLSDLFMADLTQAQAWLHNQGEPVWDGALQQVTNPFHGAHALLDVLGPLEAPMSNGLSRAWVLLRLAAVLQPPPSPRWRDALGQAVLLARAEPPFSLALGAQAQVDGVTHRALLAACAGALQLSGCAAPDLDAVTAALEPAMASPGWDVLAALIMAHPHSEPAARARGAWVDRLERGAVEDALDACLAMEAALLARLGPKDRLSRKAREALGHLQDPVTGAWRTAALPLQAFVTCHAVVLLMRGG